jgi:beta-galactosidase
MLGIATAIAFAVVFSSLLHHFRTNPIVDQALSMFLVSDGAKAAAIRLIRDPALAIGYVSLAVFLKYLLITLVILLLRLLVKVRVYPYHAYSVTMWSTAPMLLLIPIGMVLYRVIETSAYVLPAIAVVALILLWVYLRMLKGVSIMYDVPTFRVYLIGILLVVAMCGMFYAYFNVYHAAPDYLGYLYQQFVSAR